VSAAFDIGCEWKRVSGLEAGPDTAAVPLEGLLVRPRALPSDTLHVTLHPPGAFSLLPVQMELARQGAHVLCAASRYARNDSAAILERVALDLGAFVRAARAEWGYRRIVLLGWSAGASLCLFYQAQAESPWVAEAPDGSPADLTGLAPADAVVSLGGQVSRARMLVEMIDPSVRDEADPSDCDPLLDLYARRKAPFAKPLLEVYRRAQHERVRRITAWAHDTLAQLQGRCGPEADRAFLVHRTLADPYFLDARIDPNERTVGRCWLGDPERVNSAPTGLARTPTLRAWLSQWSSDDSQVDAVAAASRSGAPLLVIENTADDCVPPAHAREIFAASVSTAKTHLKAAGANHLYMGQPDLLAETVAATRNWLADHGVADGPRAPS